MATLDVDETNVMDAEGDKLDEKIEENKVEGKTELTPDEGSGAETAATPVAVPMDVDTSDGLGDAETAAPIPTPDSDDEITATEIVDVDTARHLCAEVTFAFDATVNENDEAAVAAAASATAAAAAAIEASNVVKGDEGEEGGDEEGAIISDMKSLSVTEQEHVASLEQEAAGDVKPRPVGVDTVETGAEDERLYSPDVASMPTLFLPTTSLDSLRTAHPSAVGMILTKFGRIRADCSAILNSGTPNLLLSQRQKEDREHLRSLKAILEEATEILNVFQSEVYPPPQATEYSWAHNSFSGSTVHPAVASTMDSVLTIFECPARTPAMVESALDVVTLFTTHGYVCGTASRPPRAANNRTESEPPVPSPPPPPVTALTILIETIPSVLPNEPSLSETYPSSSSVTQVDAVHNAANKALLSLVTSVRCHVHDAPLLGSIRTVFSAHLVSRSAVVRDVCRSTLADMVHHVYDRMEAASEAVAQDPPATPGAKVSSRRALRDRYRTDVYLVFRAMCKLSSKALAETSEEENRKRLQTMEVGATDKMGDTNDLPLQSKVLSLRVLWTMLDRSGPNFVKGERYIFAVRQYLCVSLVKNCMSGIHAVAYWTLRIFLVLVRNYRISLRDEIGVFVRNLFLRVLDGQGFGRDQRLLVVECLRALCSDARSATGLFLSYDCDLEAEDLFREVVGALARVATGRRLREGDKPAKPGGRRDREGEGLRLAALEVLVAILKSVLVAQGLHVPKKEETGTPGALRFSPGGRQDGGKPSWGDTQRETTLEPTVAAEEQKKAIGAQEEDRSCLSPSPTGGGAAVVSVFDRKRIAQEKFEQGSVKFRLNCRNGLLYFVQENIIPLDAREIAIFLHTNRDRMDKTQIGEVLGKEPEWALEDHLRRDRDPEEGGEGFSVRILHHYVDTVDFEGLMFDDAIRTFLSGFRLPGEAQKIDRIMEKFAEKYSRQNPKIFPSADTAFILAFSIIMLNTDLHNPSIKPERRMTLENFISNNRGIGIDGTDIPDDYLRGIYNRIQNNPFSLKEDDLARERNNDIMKSARGFDPSAIFGNDAKLASSKRQQFRREREELMVESENLFKKRANGMLVSNKSPRSEAQEEEEVPIAEIAGPMFDVMWGPLLGTLSQVLETSEDPKFITLCLGGFDLSIRIAGFNNMILARETYINSLVKLTALGLNREMTFKNIESIKALLNIAIWDGEYLNESWNTVIPCISQIARLQLFGGGLATDDTFLAVPTTNNEEEKKSLDATSRKMEENNGKQLLENGINEMLIDAIFSATNKLSVTGIIHFIHALVDLSKVEVVGGDTAVGNKGVSMGVVASNRTAARSFSENDAHPTSTTETSAPRIFALQKLVEVADYNMMDRPRIIWQQIWKEMAAHFASVGCHDNPMLSMFAIDALRQLSFKFLEKPERHDFNFQQLFLEPFAIIMESPVSREDIRELVLRCVDNMIRSKARFIRSGWKTIFYILRLSAKDTSVNISQLGLNVLTHLLDEHLEEMCLVGHSSGEDEKSSFDAEIDRKNRVAGADDFVGLIRASLSFICHDSQATNLPANLCMRALCHLSCYADVIAAGRVKPPPVSREGWNSICQTKECNAPGYTYKTLAEGEAELMVLWRPLLDGFCAGISIERRDNSCAIRRASAVSLRGVLLRHGASFSTTQWAAVLSYSIFPALQAAAEGDTSPVIKITSESPAVSSLDFLLVALPLPPGPSDNSLKKVAIQAQMEDISASRQPGPAETLVEASLFDLKKGGDGSLLQFNLESTNFCINHDKQLPEEPFPESWIATTAGVSLGMISDIFSQYILELNFSEARRQVWPLIRNQLNRWILGFTNMNCHIRNGFSLQRSRWKPCEALVRIGCAELWRCCERVAWKSPSQQVHAEWSSVLISTVSEILSVSTKVETSLHRDCVEAKLEALRNRSNTGRSSFEARSGDDNFLKTSRSTPYGEGLLIRKRDNLNGGEIEHIKLEWGASLYRTVCMQGTPYDKWNSTQENFIEKYVPALKIRSISAFLLLDHFDTWFTALMPNLALMEVRSLVDAVTSSKVCSSSACCDEDLAHAFHEAMMCEWDNDVEAIEAALAVSGGSSFSLGGSSAGFYFSQEAASVKTLLDILFGLYMHSLSEEDDSGVKTWDRQLFSESLLLKTIVEVLTKFLQSERTEGRFADPAVWRQQNKNTGRSPMYCTSFVGVVVNILERFLEFESELFQKHVSKFFGLLCSLICVQSEEIRSLVEKIFKTKVGAILGIVDRSS